MSTKPPDQSRILIVDDTPQNIQVLGTILRQEGYRINVAQNGKKAIETAHKVHPDLILLDVMMPEMDGFEACLKLRQSEETKDIPIIFLTAKKELDDVVKGFEVGGVDYVSKPFNSIELLARIRTHLDLWHKTRQLQGMADKDGLTMIANRRRFDAFYDLEWRRCLRNNASVSLVMIDIDFFKNYNDYYGHLQGDTCLKKIAEIVDLKCRRPGDLAARYGGEEFVAVLSETDLESARQVAEGIRQQVETLQIPHERSKALKFITVSMGLATTMPVSAENKMSLLSAADEQLYEAKKRGRNQIASIEI